MIKTPKLSEETFWQLIELSIKNTSDFEEQEEYLTTKLEEFSKEQIIGFRLTLDELVMDIHTSHMLCACYLLNNEDDDDTFHYFKLWVISQGKEVFCKAKESADSLFNHLNEFNEYEFDTLEYVADEALENKYDKDIYDYLPENEYPSLNVKWSKNDSESLRSICPNIFNVKIKNSTDKLSISQEISDCEQKLNFTFENNYVAFITKFGEGILGDFIRIYTPHKILNVVFKWRKRITQYWFWDEGKKVLTKEEVLQSIIVGDTLSGDEIIFHNNKYFVLPRNKEMIYKIGKTLDESIEWICSTGVLTEPFNERDFEY